MTTPHDQLADELEKAVAKGSQTCVEFVADNHAALLSALRLASRAGRLETALTKIADDIAWPGSVKDFARAALKDNA